MFVCVTLLVSAHGNPGPRKTRYMSPVFTVSCLQLLITMIEGVCRIYICIVQTLQLLPHYCYLIQQVGVSQVACSYFMEFQALYIQRKFVVNNNPGCGNTIFML